MSEFEDVQKLLRLKRYEQPPEGYFEDFLDEFQRRQRAELLQHSSRRLFVERFGTWLSGFGKQRILVGAGLSYATAMLLFFMVARNPQKEPSSDFSARLPSGSPEPVSSLLLPEVPLGGEIPLKLGDGFPSGRQPWYRPVSADPSVFETKDGRKIVEF